MALVGFLKEKGLHLQSFLLFLYRSQHKITNRHRGNL